MIVQGVIFFLEIRQILGRGFDLLTFSQERAQTHVKKVCDNFQRFKVRLPSSRLVG